MSENLAPDTPDTPPGSVTVVQQGTPPLALLGSATDADPVPPRASGTGGPERYELLEEIARGGMGVVYLARDRVLDRDVGVKTLLNVPAAESVIAARFREEARITGQLQHPNIPPVHDLGTLPDGRPYLAMKLIKGRTLDAMLKDRSDPSHHRGKYLAIFEQIAQGVAYAHAHHVIHRDLKPMNVMVGAFGEVQVMDWGLAKILTDSPAKTVIAPQAETGAATDIRPSRDESDETRPGSIFGTPAYMPREQAIGAVDQIDTRSDVFSLGGVLCVILTGKPPYIGTDAESTRQLAAIANLDDAFTRIDSCGAEPDLIALCKRCLSAERDDRPANSQAVAVHVAAYRAGVAQRLRRVETEAAEALVREAEQRKRLRVQWIGAGLLGTVLVAGVIGTSLGMVRADRARQDEETAKLAEEEAKFREQKRADGEAAAREAEGRAKQTAQAQTVRAEAQTARAEAQTARTEAQTARAEGLLIATQLQQTLDATSSGNIRLAKSLLNDCQWHLRGWEYDHLWTRVTPARSFQMRGMTNGFCFSGDGALLLASWATRTREGRTNSVRVLNLGTGAETVMTAAPGDEFTTLTLGLGKDELLGVRPDLVVQRWNLRTGEFLGASVGNPTPPKRVNPISHVCFSPDRKFIAYAPNVGGLEYVQQVKLWDVEKDVLARKLSLYKKAISVVRFSPAGTHVVSAAADQTVRLWNLGTDTETLVDFGGHTSKIWFTPDGKGLLAITYPDNKAALMLWSIADKKVTRTLPLPEAQVNELDITADGKTFATGEQDGRVRVWDYDSGKLLRSYYGHTSPVYRVRFSPDGRRLATEDYGGDIHVWEADRDPGVPTLSAGKSPLHAAAFSPDGKTFVTGGQDQMLSVWDIDGRSPIKSWKVQTRQDRYIAPINDIAYSPDGTRIATCGEDVKLWDAKTGELVRAFRGHKSVVFHLAFSPDGKRLYAAPTGHGPTVERGPADVWVWEVETGNHLARFTVEKTHKSEQAEQTDSLTFAPDGRLVTGTYNPSGGVIKFWNTADHTLDRTLSGHRGRVRSVAFSRDGTRMASSCQGDELIIWNFKTGKLLHKTRVRAGHLDRLRFSPDGTRLFAGCSDGSVRVWDPELFQEMLALPGHANGDVKALALSPDGKQLVSGGKDGSIRIWESLRRPEYADLKGHRAPVTSVAFAADGSRVFAWDKSGDLLAWSLRDGSPTETEGAPAKGTEGAITSADGRFRAEPFGSLAYGNVAVRVWFLPATPVGPPPELKRP